MGPAAEGADVEVFADVDFDFGCVEFIGRERSKSSSERISEVRRDKGRLEDWSWGGVAGRWGGHCRARGRGRGEGPGGICWPGQRRGMGWNGMGRERLEARRRG